ncbi:MAG: cytochrome c biogenesis protein CcdA [Thermodesulfovibrionales bacterium]|nr:cytochrome c biogenesis protein CcdA [Thermodesulfovibrionales bacterium]
MKDVSIPMAFLAGLLSFLSPCVLPLLPSYVSYITGISFENLTSGDDRKRVRFLTFTNSIAFIFGFSAVFVSLGASSSLIGQLLLEYREWIRIGGGILVIIFGLFISGIVKLALLLKERRFHLRGRPAGYLGSFIIGITFAAAWSPCIGPILGTILLYAASEGSASYGLRLLSVYSLGLALPFFLSSLAINTFLSYSRILYRFMRLIMLLSGLLLIIFGVLLLSNKVRELARIIPDVNIPFR